MDIPLRTNRTRIRGVSDPQIRARGQAARRREGSLTPRDLPCCDMAAPTWAAQNAARRIHGSYHNAHRTNDFLELAVVEHASFAQDSVHVRLIHRGAD